MIPGEKVTLTNLTNPLDIHNDKKGISDHLDPKTLLITVKLSTTPSTQIEVNSHNINLCDHNEEIESGMLTLSVQLCFCSQHRSESCNDCGFEFSNLNRVASLGCGIGSPGYSMEIVDLAEKILERERDRGWLAMKAPLKGKAFEIRDPKMRSKLIVSKKSGVVEKMLNSSDYELWTKEDDMDRAADVLFTDDEFSDLDVDDDEPTDTSYLVRRFILSLSVHKAKALRELGVDQYLYVMQTPEMNEGIIFCVRMLHKTEEERPLFTIEYYYSPPQCSHLSEPEMMNFMTKRNFKLSKALEHNSDTIRLIHNLLQKNSKRLDPAYVASMDATADFSISVLTWKNADFVKSFDNTSCCGNCGVTIRELKKCLRCLCVWYCSHECQTAHSKVHKKNCKPAPVV